MATALLSNLVFEVNGGCTGFFHLLNGTANVECATPTGVYVYQ